MNKSMKQSGSWPYLIIKFAISAKSFAKKGRRALVEKSLKKKQFFKIRKSRLNFFGTPVKKNRVGIAIIPGFKFGIRNSELPNCDGIFFKCSLFEGLFNCFQNYLLNLSHKEFIFYHIKYVWRGDGRGSAWNASGAPFWNYQLVRGKIEGKRVKKGPKNLPTRGK